MSPVEWLIFETRQRNPQSPVQVCELCGYGKQSQGKHCILPVSPIPFSPAAFQGQGYMFLLCFGIHHHLLFAFNIFFTLVQLISIVLEKWLWALLFLWFIKKFLSCNCYLFFKTLTFTPTIRGLYCLLLFCLLYIAFLLISVKNNL